MNWLRFLRRPIQIVLTGQIVAPKAGQVLVLTTPEALSAEQQEAVKTAIRARFGDTGLFFVIAGGGHLSTTDSKSVEQRIEDIVQSRIDQIAGSRARNWR